MGMGGPSPLASARVITYAYHRLQGLTDAVENLSTTDHFAYDAAGNRNVISDTSHFAVDDCWVVRCGGRDSSSAQSPSAA
jgi:hypothetical protein